MARRPCPNTGEDCKYFNTSEGCFSDVHHPDWPKNQYKTPTEKRYRLARSYYLCRHLHDLVHLAPPPEKLGSDEMREFLAQVALGETMSKLCLDVDTPKEDLETRHLESL